MNRLRRIQDLAAESGNSLSDALRQSSILAVDLDHAPLSSWVDRELNGYSEWTEAPDYRIFKVEPRGAFTFPWQGSHPDLPIPPSSFPERYRIYATTLALLEGVASYEGLVMQPPSPVLHYPLSYDLVAEISQSIYQRGNCVEAWWPLPVSALEGMLGTIRNRLLRFVLELKREYPDAFVGDDADTPAVSGERLSQIVNNTIYGGAASFSFGSDHVVQINIAAEVTPGDFDSVRRVLLSHGFQEDDITSLEDAVNADAPPTTRGQFGARVSEWTAAIARKSAEGMIGLPFDAAAGVITNVLTKFYGLS